MKLKMRHSLKQQLKHSISDTAQVFGLAFSGVTIPIPENRPPTFVLSKDKKTNKIKIVHGQDYYNQNRKRIEQNWG